MSNLNHNISHIILPHIKAMSHLSELDKILNLTKFVNLIEEIQNSADDFSSQLKKFADKTGIEYRLVSVNKNAQSFENIIADYTKSNKLEIRISSNITLDLSLLPQIANVRIIIDPNLSVNLTQNLLKSFRNIEITLHEKSVCSYIKTSYNESIEHLHITQEGNQSILNIESFYCADGYSSQTYDISIKGSYCENNLRSLVLSNMHNNQSVQSEHLCYAENTYLESNSKTTQSVRQIVGQNSASSFYGTINIGKGVEDSVSYQYNSNLALFSNAKISYKPELNIHCDRVECAHGATTGRIDEEVLYYMQSRGISKDIARHMMIQAFAVSHLKSEDLVSLIEDFIG